MPARPGTRTRNAAAIQAPSPASRPAWLSLGPHPLTDRVTALLHPPANRTRLAWALVATAALATAALAWSTHDTEHFFEAVRTWPHP
jgi:hypothetical protein